MSIKKVDINKDYKQGEDEEKDTAIKLNRQILTQWHKTAQKSGVIRRTVTLPNR
jgi:hypothetical protein